MPKLALVSLMTLVLLLLCISVVLGQAEQFLVGYWPFDEGAGKAAKDASGKGHNGELINDANWVQGKFGKALDFGAGGGYVVVKDDDELDLADAVTVMCWFNLNEPIVGQRRIMSKNDSIFVIFDFGAADSLDFLTKPNNDFVESTTTFEPGQWYHFAGTYDGDALRIYIDGELEGEKAGVPSIATSDLDLWIGADDWQPGVTDFPGIIDEVRFYSKALTQNEIRKAMEGPVAVTMTQEKLAVTWGSVRAAQ